MQRKITTSFLGFAAAIGAAVLLLDGCSGDSVKKPSGKGSSPATEESYAQKSPAFNADSAYYFVQKQMDFGPRTIGSDAHKQCGDWYVKQFKQYTDRVIEQTGKMKNWDGKQLPIRNIIASINPDAAQRILITAHWDSRPYADHDPDPANHTRPVPAADDGASGVAVMLEMARAIHAKGVNIGVDFICLDAEDLGKENYDDSYCLGTQYWGKHPHAPGYKAQFAINLDMVGGKGAKFVWEEISIQYAEPVLREVWDKAIKLGYSGYFYYFRHPGIIDDHKYINELTGIPAIDIICFNETTGFPAWWHTVNDDMRNIDPATMKAVGQTVLETIYSR